MQVTAIEPDGVHPAVLKMEDAMDTGGTTWIVTADAREARVFVERARGGHLKEAPSLHMQADALDPGRGRQRATVHARVGSGRSGAGDADPAAAAEARFLRKVADRLAEAFERGEFQHLVLMAPPHALGVLRAALPPAVARCVQASDPHERRGDGPDEVQRHLRAARART
jgi:protein required for attachment to host cells